MHASAKPEPEAGNDDEIESQTVEGLGERKAFTSFEASLAVVMALLFASFFLGMTISQSMALKQEIIDKGRVIFRQIVLTRRWAAEYGGVYVKKTAGVESNPWLEHPDLEAADGSTLTLRNPALITRELSEIVAEGELYRFRITSLKPLNPGNAPDDFERSSLDSFEEGRRETWGFVDSPRGREFRYMGALKTETSCLSCHAVQGYKEGDVRGGISVSFPIVEFDKKQRVKLLLTLVFALVLSAMTLLLIFRFMNRLKRELARTRAELERAATTDSLTGLLNRRASMRRLRIEAAKALRTGGSLGVAILDADDFKLVNDRHGHPVGDQVLKAIAEALSSTIRPYDLASRFGGEEMLLLFPDAGAEGALAVCERARAAIGERTAAVIPGGRGISVSVGIAELAVGAKAVPSASKQAPDVSALVEALLNHADEALYRAKAAGKDRCVVYDASAPAGTAS